MDIRYSANQRDVKRYTTEELRNELMANISHDLRTPLTMIRGCAELMRDIPGECNEENINVIINESNRLSNLVTDILDLSKMQSGVTALEISEFSLTDLVSDVVKGYSKMLSDIHNQIYKCIVTWNTNHI